MTSLVRSAINDLVDLSSVDKQTALVGMDD